MDSEPLTYLSIDSPVMEHPSVTPASIPVTSISSSRHPFSDDPNFQGVMAQVYHQAEISALSCIFVLSIFTNALVFLLFYWRPTMRTFSNRFVLNLSLVHFVQAVVVMPTVLVTYVLESWWFGNIWCQITGSVIICLNVASVLAILLIAIDRGCAVNNPLHYTTTITKHRTCVLIIGMWCISIVSGLPPLFGISKIEFRPDWGTCYVAWTYGTVADIVYGSMLSMIGFFFPLIAITWIYLTMFQAARMNTARTRKHSVSSGISDVTLSVHPQKNTALQHLFIALRKHRKADRNPPKHLFWGECKAARTGLLVFGTLILCWLPFFLSILIELHFLIPDNLRFFVMFTTFCACIINPYIYVYRNKTSRSYIKKLFECHKELQDCYFACGKWNYRKNKEYAKNAARNISASSSYVLRMANSKNVVVTAIPDSCSHTEKNESVQDMSVTDYLLKRSSLSSPDCKMNPMKAHIFSLPSPRKLLHQDSTSSSDSSDLGMISVLGSSGNLNEDTSQWYTQFQYKTYLQSARCSSAQDTCVPENGSTEHTTNCKTTMKTFLHFHNLPSEIV